MTRRVFLTGGAGFIGSHLTSKFLFHGWDVLVFDAYYHYAEVDNTFVENLALRKALLAGAKILKGSTLDVGMLRDALDAFQPDVVVHLAGLPIANRALKNSEMAFTHILKGTHNVLEAMRHTTNARFVYISSSMAYGNFSIVPVPEHAVMSPVEPYGAMKLAGEVLTRAFAHAYKFPYIIIRPSAVYGPGDCNRRVVQIFLEKALRGEIAIVYSGPDTIMDFTFVEDLVEGIYRASIWRDKKDTAETFNLTRGEGRSLQELVKCISTLVPNFQWCERESDAVRPRRGALDISRARKLLTYDPQWPLERGLAQYRDYMLEYNPSLMWNDAAVKEAFG